MTKYEVLLTRYPERFTVEADSEEEARKIAVDQVDFSIWESEVEVLE